MNNTILNKRITIRLTDEDYNYVSIMAKDRYVSLANYIRILINCDKLKNKEINNVKE